MSKNAAEIEKLQVTKKRLEKYLKVKENAAMTLRRQAALKEVNAKIKKLKTKKGVKDD